MANGFGYQVTPVNPTQIQAVQQGLSGLGDVLVDTIKERKAQAAMQEAQGALQSAYDSGDPNAVAKAMLQYPKMAENLQGAIQYQSDATKQNLVDTTRSVLSSRDNPEQALMALDRRIEMLQASGADASDSIEARQELAQAIQSGNTDPFFRSAEMVFASQAPEEYKAYSTQRGMGGNQASIQFGAQQTLKDSEGNLFFATTRRNPQSGEVESVTASIDGSDKKPQGNLSIAGGYGLTAEEKINQIAKEGGAQTRGKAMENVRQDYIKQGTAAKGLLRKTDRMLELLDNISTGKTAGLRKAMGDLFGVTDPDLGEFNSLAGQQVLGSIRQLGANPTEGERAYLEQISPGIQQGGKVNRAILDNLKEIQQRQIERARWLVKNPDKTVEEYLLLDDDFVPQSEPSGEPAQGVSSKPQPQDQFSEGTVIQNGAGQKMILRNNQWIPFEG